MKIKSLKLHSVAVQRQYGTVIAMEGGKAKRTVQKSLFYFLEVATDNGLAGWGEISDIEPDDLPEDPGEYAELLSAFLVGRSPFDVQRMHREFEEHFDTKDGKLAKYAECALDMAMYDLAGQASRRPVHQLLGGAVRKSVHISWVAYIREELDLIREEIHKRTAEGFSAFKLKVGVDIDLDEKRLAIARETAGKDASIKIDANEGWSIKDAVKNIRRLSKYRLAGVETPVPREDPADIAAVRRQVDVPILEHVSDLDYGLALLKANAVDAFNLATTGAGGLWPARRLVTLAEAGKVGVLIGSTVEMGPGTLAQLHLAATVPNLTLPSDLIGPGMYRRDVLAKPLRYREGNLDVPTGVGLGGKVDRRKLKALAFVGRQMR
jgi:L-alanine-DL-glutamate epimerase-like enolase superfamily enzyme